MLLRRKAKRFTRFPVRTQEAVLRRLLKQASNTEWGRKYQFAALAQDPDVIDAYQRAVPLHTQRDIADDVHRTRQGERDILWPGTMRHFAVSSGTASAGTVLPLSREMMRRNTRFSFGVALQYMRTTRNFRILGGRQISMPGRIAEDPEFPGTLVGETSGFLLEAIPAQFRFMYRNVSREIAFLPHWSTKLSAIVDYALQHDIRVIATVPSWAVSMLKMAITEYNTRHGTSVSTAGEIWPNLQLFISGGVALSSYRPVLKELIGLPSMDFLETYGASEGFFSYQVELDDPSMLLDLDNGLFFDFVRFDEIHDPSPERLHIGQVVPDVRYVPYVTSCSGLWSYMVGDVIRFTSVSPHKIVVAGRTSEMLDRFGERVFGEDARQTLERVCQQTGATVADYHVTSRSPTLTQMPYMEWLVEFVTPPPSLPDFTTALDTTLCEMNRHYQVRRESQAFESMRLTPLRPGTFAQWLHKSRAFVSTQTKVRRMSEEPQIADGLIALQEAGPSQDGS